MKRQRRLSIEFEHREMTVTVSHTIDGAAAEGERASGNAPTTCRMCGCPNLLPLSESMARYSGSREDLSRALTNGELHLAAGGSELWLCERSFEIFKETRR